MYPALTRITRLTVLVAAVAMLGSACVYRMAIQQGNYLDPTAVAQLKEGMTRSQVRFLLGTPMVPDAFNDNRWDYLYYLKRGRTSDTEKRQLIVWFEDDKVARIEKINVLAPLEVPITPAPKAPADDKGDNEPATPQAPPVVPQAS